VRDFLIGRIGLSTAGENEFSADSPVWILRYSRTKGQKQITFESTGEVSTLKAPFIWPELSRQLSRGSRALELQGGTASFPAMYHGAAHGQRAHPELSQRLHRCEGGGGKVWVQQGGNEHFVSMTFGPYAAAASPLVTGVSMAHFIGCLNYFHALAVVLSILHGSDAHPWLVGQVAVALCLTLLEEQALLKLMSLATLIKVRRADGSGKMAFFHGDIPHLLLMVASKDTRDPAFFPLGWTEKLPSVIKGYQNADGVVQPLGAFGAGPSAAVGLVAPGAAAIAVGAAPDGPGV